jgi:hypothetical protein
MTSLTSQIHTLAKYTGMPHKKLEALLSAIDQAIIDNGTADASKEPIHQLIPAPDASSNVTVLIATVLTTDVQTITVGITNPDVPRVPVIKGVMAGGSLTGNVVITGTNINNAAISDTIALNNSNAVAGSKAFKTISQIQLPVRVTVADTVSVGFNDQLGLSALIDRNSVFMCCVDKVYETVRPTVTYDAADVAKCTIDTSTVMNALKDVDVWFMPKV